ncbi:MAG: GTPase HflX [Gammaproteobacteria bacterium]|nr:MAG: GTPase HflX [Gammaproteobacteria bacterium]
MFERPRSNSQAILVSLDFLHGEDNPLEEFELLARSAGAEPSAVISGRRAEPEPRYLIGKGKAEEVRDAARRTGAGLVLVNHELTPSQERNLERLCEVRVLDRSGLILDIFAQRAQTFEGKLQVELAQLEHLSTRLVRGWSHLERQKGGIGLRGPGETQLETDRRLIGVRMKHIRARLEKVRRQREQGRRRRRRAAQPTISLVGYTNAGKSTLFNRLTGAGTYAADQLFATLDPTHRMVELPGAGRVVLVDTVGFIRNLPHELVAAFRATLEESRLADLLIHVTDAHEPERQEQVAQVEAVLEEIGADGVPLLEVCNKIDLLEEGGPRVEYDSGGEPVRVWISARTGAGLDLLREAVASRLHRGLGAFRLELPPAAGRLRARLHELQAVQSEESLADGGWRLELLIEPARLDSLIREAGLEPDEVIGGGWEGPVSRAVAGGGGNTF